MAKKLALIIGIENYPKMSGLSKVDCAINDALKMADYAQQAGFFLINGKPLLDDEALYAQVLNMLKLLFYYAKPEDFILIYFSGHGHYAEDGGYLIPFDYQGGNDVDESCCISFDSFEKRFKNKKTNQFLFFLDTCHSGYVGRQMNIRGAISIHLNLSLQVQKKIKYQMNKMVQQNESSQKIGRVIFASSSPQEKSHSIKELNHGLFTYYLLSNLKTEKGKKQINIKELIRNVNKNIIEYCLNNNLKQTPIAYVNIKKGKFFVPTFDVKEKEEEIVSEPDTSENQEKGSKTIDSKKSNLRDTQKVNTSKREKLSFKDNKKYARIARSKRKQYIIIFSIFMIVLVSLAIFITVKINKTTELRERDNQASEYAQSKDTIEALKTYISEHPSGLHLPKIKKRLKELEEMPTHIYTANLSSKINVSKNKKGYWEGYYAEYGVIMVYIPEGNFKMGQTKEEKNWLLKNVDEKDYNKYYKNETPAHDVFLSGYWMGKTEVTNEQYVTFLNDSRIDHKDGCQGNQCIDTKKESRYSHILGSKGNYHVEIGYKNHPVTDVSWYGAVEYCKWLSKETGFDFKLPTEAQWEKAARWLDVVAKKRVFMFPWGDQEPNKTLANFNFEKTASVDSYHEGASPYGLLNMAGNVWEWCNDWYDEKYYSKLHDENPSGPKNGKNRVRRGGGWNNMAISLRCAVRKEDTPSKRYSNVGFRLCQGIK